MNPTDGKAGKVRHLLDIALVPSGPRAFSSPAIVTAVVVLAVLSGLGGVVYVFLGDTNSAFSLFAACLSLFAWGAMIEFLARIAFHAERAADAVINAPSK